MLHSTAKKKKKREIMDGLLKGIIEMPGLIFTPLIER